MEMDWEKPASFFSSWFCRKNALFIKFAECFSQPLMLAVGFPPVSISVDY
jgi:hypothetical protein